MLARHSFFIILCAFGWKADAVTIQYLSPESGDRKSLETATPHSVQIDNFPTDQQNIFAASTQDSDNDGVADIDDNCPSTGQGLTVDICGCPVPLCPESGGPCEAGRYLRYFEVKFVFDKTVITRESQRQLTLAAREMIRDRNARLDLSAHTDALGSEGYNQKLAKGRADTLYEFLIMQGVPKKRIKAASFGENLPAFGNQTQRGRDENRRGEMLIGWWDNGEQPVANQWASFGCDLNDLACKPISDIAQVKPISSDGFEVAYKAPYLNDADIDKLSQLRAQLNSHPRLQALITSSYAEPAAVEVAKRLLSKDVAAWRLNVSSLGLTRPQDALSESVSVTIFESLAD